MWNHTFVVILGILIGFTFLAPAQSMGVFQADIVWQLVVISSEPACSTYHYYMVEKYNEISQEYLNLYQVDHGNYKPECYTDVEFTKEYQKPLDLDLNINFNIKIISLSANLLFFFLFLHLIRRTFWALSFY